MFAYCAVKTWPTQSSKYACSEDVCVCVWCRFNIFSVVYILNGNIDEGEGGIANLMEMFASHINDYISIQCDWP